MPRAFWKGAISFGLVTIPVKMYVATETKSLSFHYLHKKDLIRPKQVLYCPADNEYFGREDTVSGYEYIKGKYVVLTDKDFEKVPLRTTHTIDILGFVEENEIDPLFYYNTHYLEADEMGVKPFSLLRDVLRKEKRAGIAKVSFSRREHLCCLRPLEQILVLHSMHYQDEIRSFSELSPPETSLRSEELEMATSLVKSMVTDFKPEKYHDEYRKALKDMVEARIAGKEIKAPPQPPAEMPDLMAALRASVESAHRKEPAKKEPVAAKRH